jgi:hypothetical protein
MGKKVLVCKHCGCTAHHAHFDYDSGHIICCCGHIMY